MSESAHPFPPYDPESPEEGAVAQTAETKNPAQSVVSAFFVGLLLTILPVRRIIGGLTGLVLTLLRPVLLILGAVKLYEEIEERRK